MPFRVGWGRGFARKKCSGTFGAGGLEPLQAAYWATIGTLEEFRMCRNIRVLANFEPPASDDEVRASALQFVRKLSGTTRPSKANESAFNRAVDEVTAAARRLIDSLQINAPPRNREVEAQKARERSRQRFAREAPRPLAGDATAAP
ncbi:MAG TPA: DUF2277 domain-containing protein [Gemmatimonadaceae bacterium]